LPEEGVPVWIYDGETMFVCTLEFADEGYFWGRCYDDFYYDERDSKWKTTTSEADDYHPTHWMLLPEPPEATP
jgi:hypothetical protein